MAAKTKWVRVYIRLPYLMYQRTPRSAPGLIRPRRARCTPIRRPRWLGTDLPERVKFSGLEKDGSLAAHLVGEIVENINQRDWLF
jgi:hypothetical protein